MGAATETMMAEAMGYMIAIAVVGLFFWIFQAVLAASLARQKGYSGGAGFFIALIAPVLGLIYQAGRPVSQDMEDERQRALAGRIAKAMRKGEQAQNRAAQPEEEAGPVRKKFREAR